MREAFTLDFREYIIHGTAHYGPRRSGRGVFFFNSGAQPRCSRGDLAAHVADALAELGYDCFRVDLPGLGDSDGQLPPHYAELYKGIQNGCHVEPAGRIVQRVSSDAALREVFLFGLCGGAATAVFLAASVPPNMLRGLMLFDLPFEDVREYDVATSGGGASPATGLASRARFWKGKLHDRFLASRYEPQVTAIYHAAKRFCSRLMPARLPANANGNLLRHLLQLLESRMPVLLVFAVPTKKVVSDTAYFKYLKRQGLETLRLECIHGTTHSFVENGGFKKVMDSLRSWLLSVPASSQAFDPDRMASNQRGPSIEKKALQDAGSSA